MKDPLDDICDALAGTSDLLLERTLVDPPIGHHPKSKRERLIFKYKDKWLCTCFCEEDCVKYFLYFAYDDGTPDPSFSIGTSGDVISVVKKLIAEKYYIL